HHGHGSHTTSLITSISSLSPSHNNITSTNYGSSRCRHSHFTTMLSITNPSDLHHLGSTATPPPSSSQPPSITPPHHRTIPPAPRTTISQPKGAFGYNSPVRVHCGLTETPPGCLFWWFSSSKRSVWVYTPTEGAYGLAPAESACGSPYTTRVCLVMWLTPQEGAFGSGLQPKGCVGLLFTK
nr:hypothetical protein [Tanacetum cinerariifolium]